VADNYGTDVLLGATGLDSSYPLISGPKVVAYNLFRRCTTDESLPAYKGNSFDIRKVASAKLNPATLPAIEKDVIRVAIYEPRISTVYPTVTLDTLKNLLLVNIKGVLVTGETFTLILSIDKVSAAVVGIQVL
jgi:hypothetical protein